MPGPRSAIQAAVLAGRRQAPFLPHLPQTLDEMRQLLRPTDATWWTENADAGLAPDDTGAWARKKGLGFLGEVPMPDGGVMTEYSMADRIAGEDREFPAVVPTLTPTELAQLIAIAQQGAPMPPAIAAKARDFAARRVQQGRSPFAQPGDLRLGMRRR